MLKEMLALDALHMVLWTVGLGDLSIAIGLSYFFAFHTTRVALALSNQAAPMEPVRCSGRISLFEETRHARH